MWCLLDSEVLVPGQPAGIGDTGGEQGKREVIAAVNGQVGDVLLCDGVGLAAALGFDYGWLIGYFDDRLYRRRLQFEIGD